MVQFFKPAARAARKPLPTSPLRLQIERLDDDGRGVGRHQGKLVFIAGALPGEQVQVRLSADHGHYAEGQLLAIEQASAERQPPPCRYFGQCGGCQLQHASLSLQRESKQQQLRFQLRQLLTSDSQILPPLVGDGWGYRRRARLALRHEGDNLQLGWRARGSSQICSVDECAVLSPTLSQWLPRLQQALARHGRKGDFGHAELQLDQLGPRLLLRRLRPLPAARQAALVAELAGLRLCFEDNDGQLRDASEQPVTPGHYPLAGLEIGFLPHHFIQINGEVNALMVAQALAWLQPERGERILDLFCGIGNFSLPLAAAGARVTAIEGVAEMVTQARANAAALGLTLEFMVADLQQGLPAQLPAIDAGDKILLDPSREGAKGLMPALAKSAARQLVYVSCNPASLARDGAVLVAQGWQLQQLVMVDMFPQTHHIEAMACFVRR